LACARPLDRLLADLSVSGSARPAGDGRRGGGSLQCRVRGGDAGAGELRSGYRTREWDTRAGTIELAIPKLRAGSYSPSFLEHRRCAKRALASVPRRTW